MTWAIRGQANWHTLTCDRRGLKPISYLTNRPVVKIPPTQGDTDRLLFPKFIDWQYEEEWRSWCSLDERDASTGFYFYSLDGFIQLREVIAGPLCDSPKERIDEALKDYDYDIGRVKARLVSRVSGS